MPDNTSDNRYSFTLFVERVLALLETRGLSLEEDSRTRGATHDFKGKLLTQVEREDASFPVSQLAGVFGLDPLETDLVLLAFAASSNARVAKAFAVLNEHPDRTYLTPAIAEHLLDLPADINNILQYHISGAGRLRLNHILNSRFFEKHYSHYTQPLILETRIISFLLGSDELDMHNRQYLRDAQERETAFFHESAQERILSFAQQNRSARHTQIVYIHGPEGAGQECAARAIADDCSDGMIVLKSNEYLRLSPEWARHIFQIAIRESRLLNRCLYIPDMETILASPLASILRGVLEDIFFGTTQLPPVLLGGEGPVDTNEFSLSGHCFVIELKVPSVAQRIEIWNELLRGHAPLEGDITVQELAGRYKFTPGQIRVALNYAKNEGVARSDRTGLSRADLTTGCRMSSNRKLTDLAKRIEIRFTWDDLVLSENLTEQVRNVAHSYRQIHTFFESWDFGGRFQYGRGISALFGGPSGTGKTMAASVIASELDLELYKIDLSRVVSKYIGETEKNLARIFKEAETSNAILFFDEADALFGKRSEIKDAHDRHANIEINYLLQQMEEYDGLTILATNLSQNIDDAFTRRLQFIINFTKPKAAERERIWRGMFPEKAPVSDDVDFALLAENVALAGGGIKNVIFHAGMMALEEGSAISMRHLVRGVRLEYLKENIPFIAANFGAFGQA